MSTKKSAFTLIELLVVIVIVAVLAAMILSAIGGAYRMARRTRATTEVKSIASALEMYYAEYHKWPAILGTDPEHNGANNRIEGQLAAMLQGECVGPSGSKDNLKKIKFMQFKAFDTTQTDPTKYPVNAWWGATASGATNCAYYFKVDQNFDNQIDPEPALLPKKGIRRSVLVWTVNGDTGAYIASADEAL